VVAVTHISDPADRRLDDFRAVREPELAASRGLFIAEGRLVVRRLLTQSRLATRSVLVTPSARQAVEDVMPSRPDLEVYVAPQDVMNTVTGFNIHRGCLATGVRPATTGWRELATHARRLVILEHVGDADNVGAIFRSAAAFDADGVLIGPTCADPLYRKAIRTSMGAALTLPFAYLEPWPAALYELTNDGWAVAALTPTADAVPLHDFAASSHERVALAVGHEGTGLSEEALRAANYHVRIPIRAAVDSLNVAAAAAIALYEVTVGRVPRAAAATDGDPANRNR
jgi:tRNA G18 (ribose-2'-O)-methylase SpoU